MPLHGNVQVNDELICYWWAGRQTPLRNVREPDSEVHTYTCRVEWPQPIFGYTDAVEFELDHRYGEGAERLAIAVLGEASRRRNVVHATDGGPHVSV